MGNHDVVVNDTTRYMQCITAASALAIWGKDCILPFWSKKKDLQSRYGGQLRLRPLDWTHQTHASLATENPTGTRRKKKPKFGRSLVVLSPASLADVGEPTTPKTKNKTNIHVKRIENDHARLPYLSTLPISQNQKWNLTERKQKPNPEEKIIWWALDQKKNRWP